ncbi:hypothetical protein ANO11243_072480 [Dothideomycetidae sp. 11243]|nr:hypothetical protein ANO11243_072480 [fungal sp. No.11243]
MKYLFPKEFKLHNAFTSTVSAFCRAAFRHVFPTEWFGGRLDLASNRNVQKIMQSIDQFIHLNRYESMTLHSVLEGLSIPALSWLKPPHQNSKGKICLSDITKRKQLLSELLYYVFDSFLIPLIGANFYVTESSAHRNQLLFFRHDVWRELSAPALTELRTSMFEDIKPAALKRLQSRRQLGISRIRLLPKEHGLRPIINLRRRTLTKVDGKPVLGYSINSSIKPAFSVLNFLKTAQPELLGCSIFSSDEIFPRLQRYRQYLKTADIWGQPLYFAKIDVRACFDTIPQAGVVRLLEAIVSSGEYSIGRHAEGKVSRLLSSTVAPKVSWKFHSEAQTAGLDAPLSQMLEGHLDGRAGRVIVDKVSRRYETRARVLEILREHIERNVVQIGNRVYRQKVGIPQGSVVSSLLCSLFYGLLDKSKLAFLQDRDCLLSRLIDDFLLITPHLSQAQHFLKVMHAGLKDFGVTVKVEKTRTNFAFSDRGQVVNQLAQLSDFPYCGLCINTQSLDVSADISRRRPQDLRSSVTVEHSKTPGKNFYRKAMDMVKLHMHAMLLSTSYNSVETVTKSVHEAFTDIAWRCVHYMTALAAGKRPGSRLMIATISDVIELSYAMMKTRRQTKSEGIPYKFALTKLDVQKIAYEALLGVFQRRQTRFTALVEWLRIQLSYSEQRSINLGQDMKRRTLA